MTATTKPRKSAPKRPGASSTTAYQRPLQVYVHGGNEGATLEERIDAIRACIYEADEKLDSVRSAVDAGSAAEVLLELITGRLSTDAWKPLLRNEDEEHLPVTKEDAAAAYEGFFPLLAALEGVLALSTDSIIYSTVAEMFNLLDWAQTECDSAALGALLPEAQVESDSTTAAPAAPVVAPAAEVDTLSDAFSDFDIAVAIVEFLAHEHQKSPIVWAARRLMDLCHSPFLEAVERDDHLLQQQVSTDLSIIVGLLEAAVPGLEGRDELAMRAAWTFADKSKGQLDECISAVERAEARA
jgi:hypothetical protein